MYIHSSNMMPNYIQLCIINNSWLRSWVMYVLCTISILRPKPIPYPTYAPSCTVTWVRMNLVCTPWSWEHWILQLVIANIKLALHLISPHTPVHVANYFWWRLDYKKWTVIYKRQLPMRIHHSYINLTATEVSSIGNDWETRYCNSTSDKRAVSEFYYLAVTFLVKNNY